MKKDLTKPQNANETKGKLPAALEAVKNKDGQVTGITLVSDNANNPYKSVGGSESDDFNLILLSKVLRCVWVENHKTDPEAQTRNAAAVITALGAFQPKDEIEGMIAGQAVALHQGALECFRRAMLPEQPPDIAARLRKDGTNMARAMTDMLDALDRKRGKGPQVVRVERVVVHEGGQAIVGNVTPGGRGKSQKSEGEPYA